MQKKEWLITCSSRRFVRAGHLLFQCLNSPSSKPTMLVALLSSMVKTRSGKTVVHTVGSYGRAIAGYEKEVARLKHEVTVLQRKNRYLTRELDNLRGNNGNESGNEPRSNLSRNDRFKFQISGALKTVLDRNRHWKGALVAEVLWDYQDGALQPHLLKLARIHFRTHVFTPFNIIREMDLAGGTLSYEGIDVIRRVATSGVMRFHGSMIPSKSTIKRMAGMVEWFAKGHCPFSDNQTSKKGGC
jgi:hypothetical protein